MQNNHVLLSERLRELHLFAGAGGGILGGILLGHTPVCAVEIEPYCRKVLLQRQRDGILPRFPIWDDVRTFDGKPWRGRVDVVCGGFPCQDISVASGSSAKGIDGERSGLWNEMARVIREIRPRYAFVENSQMLVGRGLAVVLGGFAEMGFDARWGIISARDSGAPHLRERVWVLATNTDEMRLLEGVQKPTVLCKKIGIGSKWNGHTAGGGCNPLERWGWTPQSTFTRVDDGVANRVDRIKAIGNGQVPAVVRLAWRMLAPSTP